MVEYRMGRHSLANKTKKEPLLGGHCGFYFTLF